MKNLNKGTVWIAILFLAGSWTATAEMRTWTSSSGATVEAELEETVGANALLRNKTGKQFKIGINRLSEADQAYISKQKPSEKAKPTSVLPKKIPGKLFAYAKAVGPDDAVLKSLKLRVPDYANVLGIQYGPASDDVLFAVFDPSKPRTSADAVYI